MDINAKVLSEVAYQLEQGNPWWGLALCNRYLAKEHPLRRAIARRFVTRIGAHQARCQLAKELIQGGLECRPSKNLQGAIGARCPRRIRAVVIPKPRSASRSRLAVRERSVRPAAAIVTRPHHARRAQAGVRIPWSNG